MERRLRLAEHGPHLWTRGLASELRGQINELLGALEPGDSLVLDLEEVEAFDYSFANEFFGRAMIDLPSAHPGRFLLVENVDGFAREDLGNALDALGLAMVERRNGALGLIGKAHPADRETFAVIVQVEGPVTAATLSEHLGLNLTTMNERLGKLSSAGLIRRERGVSPAGREPYQYWAPA